MVKLRRILNRLPSSYVRIRGEFEDSLYASVCKTQVRFPHRLGLLLYVRVRACGMLDKGKPAIYWGIFTEEGYGIMPARGRRGPASAEGTMYRAPTSVGRSLGGPRERWRPKGKPLQMLIRRRGGGNTGCL